MENPQALFEQWMTEVQKTSEIEPYSMVVSTVDAEGRPSSRVVFLRRTIEGIYYFFTNYSSRKGQAIADNPYAALNFHWRQPVHRQVRIEGRVIKASPEISDEYFNSRARGSQIGAWSSPQSQTIIDREDLEERVKRFEQTFENKPVPRPEFWGGYGIIPERFEFWEEGASRLHQRRLFTLSKDPAKKNKKNQWEESLIAP